MRVNYLTIAALGAAWVSVLILMVISVRFVNGVTGLTAMAGSAQALERVAGAARLYEKAALALSVFALAAIGLTAALIIKLIAPALSGSAENARKAGNDETRRLIEELTWTRKEAEETSAELKKTISDLEEFALMAVRRERKMQEIRERLRKAGDSRQARNDTLQ